MRRAVCRFGLSLVHPAGALWHAADAGNVSEVQAQLARGAYINQINTAGFTPLHVASRNGHTNVVRLLLSAPEIKVNERDEFGRTPLHLASREGKADITSLLLAAPGINVNQTDVLGCSPLSKASASGHTAMVKLLLAAPGINVNQASEEQGFTPLLLASWHGHIAVVELLLAAPGIKVDQEDDNDYTPLDVETCCGHTAVVHVFRVHLALESYKRIKTVLASVALPRELVAVVGAMAFGKDLIVQDGPAQYNRAQGMLGSLSFIA